MCNIPSLKLCISKPSILPVDDHHQQQQHSLHSASQPVLQSTSNSSNINAPTSAKPGGNNGKLLTVPGKASGKQTILLYYTHKHTYTRTHSKLASNMTPKCAKIDVMFRYPCVVSIVFFSAHLVAISVTIKTGKEYSRVAQIRLTDHIVCVNFSVKLQKQVN